MDIALLPPVSPEKDTFKLNSRRRDSSWDRRWQRQLEQNSEQVHLPRSSVFTRSPWLPRKVNRDLWETKIANQRQEKSFEALNKIVPLQASSAEESDCNVDQDQDVSLGKNSPESDTVGQCLNT